MRNTSLSNSLGNLFKGNDVYFRKRLRSYSIKVQNLHTYVHFNTKLRATFFSKQGTVALELKHLLSALF